MASLFGSPAFGGTLQDKVAQALAFAQNARGTTAPVAAEPVLALADDVAPAVETAASATTEVVAPAVVDQGVDLAAAARAAANQSLADPAYLAATTQQPTIVIRPNVVVEGSAGVQEIVVDVAIPRAQPNVVIAPATATVIDPATGQAVASAGEGVATSRASGFRSWGAGDIGSLFGGGGARSVSAPAGASLLDKLRAGIPDISALRGAGAASTVSEAADVVRAAKPSLLSQLRSAAEVAVKASPKG